MRRVLAALLMTVAVPLISCGGSVNQICNDFCECEGCSDEEVEDCNDDADELQDDVAREECSAELDILAECFRENADCDDSQYTIDVGDCDDELDDFADCCDNDCDLDAFFG